MFTDTVCVFMRAFISFFCCVFSELLAPSFPGHTLSSEPCVKRRQRVCVVVQLRKHRLHAFPPPPVLDCPSGDVLKQSCVADSHIECGVTTGPVSCSLLCCGPGEILSHRLRSRVYSLSPAVVRGPTHTVLCSADAGLTVSWVTQPGGATRLV